MNKAPLITTATWVSRVVVLAVFLMNLWCIVGFFFFPERYSGYYELSGLAGNVAIRGIAVAFLMWNVTFPFVIFHPLKNLTVYTIVLIQQAVGLIGESIILQGIESGHSMLSSSIERFIFFDGLGLISMLVAYIFLRICVYHGTMKEQKRS